MPEFEQERAERLKATKAALKLRMPFDIAYPIEKLAAETGFPEKYIRTALAEMLASREIDFHDKTWRIIEEPTEHSSKGSKCANR